MPGIGPLLGPEFLAPIGNDLADFTSQDGLAAFAGLAPAPHDARVNVLWALIQEGRLYEVAPPKPTG
ncbi:transposase [Streptomyces sp. NPDC050988]|uniref:transposase n=1 Tax=Streptomyces sp. NPDC050988 TaxID=3365637 RepID=UPI00379CB7AE